jgi:hypothetical protein
MFEGGLVSSVRKGRRGRAETLQEAENLAELFGELGKKNQKPVEQDLFG